MLTIDNKFNIGDECYTYYRKPIHYKCPICEGAGEFEYKGHKIWCKNCSGSGKLHNAHQCVAEPCRVVVTNVKVNMNRESANVRYVVRPVEPEINAKNRSEDNLFWDLETCEEHCRQINQREIHAEF